jgi:hypothetical protein
MDLFGNPVGVVKQAVQDTLYFAVFKGCCPETEVSGQF